MNLVARTEFIFHEAAAVMGEAQGYNQTWQRILGSS